MWFRPHTLGPPLSLPGYVGMRRQETADLSPQRGPPQVSHLKPTMGVISVSKLIQTFISTTTIWLKSRMTWRGIWLKLRLRLREDKRVGGWVLVIPIGWVGVAGNWPAWLINCGHSYKCTYLGCPACPLCVAHLLHCMEYFLRTRAGF